MAELNEAMKIDRLREEQLRAVEQTREKIQQFNKFRDDYQALQDRLRTLPDKVKHDVMVPFGKLAFMPGQLVHTNEIMVLLGDNWFVERSAKQACEIIDRRMENLDATMEDLKKQQGLLEPRLDFTQQMKNMAEDQTDVVEIKEDYDPEKERQWKEEHRKRVQRQKQEERDQIEGNSKKKEELTDEELWRRLDELELQESQRRELRNLPDEPSSEAVEQERRVHWDQQIQGGQQDEMSSSESIASSDEEYTDDEDDSDEEEEEEEEEQPTRRPRVIHFSHSEVKPPDKVAANDSTCITSPADIAKQFTPDTNPKSILKKSSKSESEPESPDVTPCVSQGQKVNSKAFSSAVVERSAPQSSSEAAAAPSKRVSKFKAQRMQQNR